MEYLVGLLLALGVALLAAAVGFDRAERAFYSTVLIVVATYYVLFAVMGASGRTLIVEIIVTCGFLLIAVVGYKGNYGSWLPPSLGTDSLTSSIVSSFRTPAYRDGGRDFAWHLMCFSAGCCFFA